MQFDFIRKYKNKLAKRNRLVIYDSQLMRIASTQGDGLVLRRRALVHPNDEGLVYEKSEAHFRAINLLERGLDRMSPELGCLDDDYVADFEIAKRILLDIKRAYNSVSPAPTDGDPNGEEA